MTRLCYLCLEKEGQKAVFTDPMTRRMERGSALQCHCVKGSMQGSTLSNMDVIIFLCAGLSKKHVHVESKLYYRVSLTAMGLALGVTRQA